MQDNNTGRYSQDNGNGERRYGSRRDRRDDRPRRNYRDDGGDDRPRRNYRDDGGDDRPRRNYRDDGGNDRPRRNYRDDGGNDRPRRNYRDDGGDRRRARDDSRNPRREGGRNFAGEGYADTVNPDREFDENRIEGRNAVIEAYRAGRTIEKLFLLEGPAEGAMQTVLRLAKEKNTPIRFLSRQRLDQLSQTGKHQGVIAQAAAFHYSELEDLFAKASEKGEDPFFILLDQIEDPHNLGAIIRTANLAGAHGVIIPKDRAVGLTATAAKASAGALHYTPVVKVTNLGRTMEELKKRGLWFVCADMGGTPMTKLSMTGPIGLVIGAEGSGVSRLIKEKCDMIATIPMKGEIDSLNASVAAGVLMYEIVRQREAE